MQKINEFYKNKSKSKNGKMNSSLPEANRKNSEV